MNILGQIQSIKKDSEVVKKVTENIKGGAIDIKRDTKCIKENTESLKKDLEIIKGKQKNLEEQLTQIKESVTEKTADKIKRKNISDPEELTFSELYFFAFFFALNWWIQIVKSLEWLVGIPYKADLDPNPDLQKKGTPKNLLFSRYSSFCISNYTIFYQVCDAIINIRT